MNKQNIINKILAEVMPIAEERVKEMFSNTDDCKFEALLDEHKIVSDIEYENEKYVKDICDEYGLEYSANDAVYGKKEQLNAMKTVYKLISQKMKVSIFRWMGGAENCYYFCFYSNQPV